MVNLFRWQANATAQLPGALTGALIALLEHSDRRMLQSLLDRLELPWQVQEGLEFQFPVEGAPGLGEVRAPGHWRLLLLSQAPAAPWDSAWVSQAITTLSEGDGPQRLVVVTPTARRLAELREVAADVALQISWEQVDRWLADSLQQYDPNTRTGFLIEQFRHFLPAAGLEYFSGFDGRDLRESLQAVEVLKRLSRRAEQLYTHLAPALRSEWPALTQARAGSPEDLLSGYLYRDFTQPQWGAGAFLRIALNLPDQLLEVALWVVSTGHERFAELEKLMPELTKVEDLTLRLWSQEGERRIRVSDLTPGAIEWSRYQTGWQVALPFAALEQEGLVDAIAEKAGNLAETLGPILGAHGEVH